MEGQLRLFILMKDVKDDKSIYRLKRGWKLCFACDPSLQAANVRLFWNVPEHPSTQAVHDHYKELIWKKNDQLSHGYEFITSPHTIHLSGTFKFFYTVDGSDSYDNCNGYGYFIVDPNLTVGCDDEPLGMDSLQLQTVLPKLLGPFNKWKDRLLVSHQTGYNMIHFTPIQSLNTESHSSYSISDQLQLNPAFSTPESPCTLQNVSDLVKHMKEQWKVLSITDMVYNHTANNSQWLTEHPESAYNLRNSPHLKPAYLLDCLVHQTSMKMASASQELNMWADLKEPDNIQRLRDYLRVNMSALKLHEFYTVDISRAVGSFSAALQAVLHSLRAAPDTFEFASATSPVPALSIQQDTRFRKLQSSVNVRDALQLYTADIIDIGKSPESATDKMAAITEDLKERLIQLNKEKEKEVQNHLDVSLDNILRGVIYRFVSEDGLKSSKVTPSTPLVERYFLCKENGRSFRNMQSIEDIAASLDNEEVCKFIMAHNGWVMGDDPLNNFAELGSNVYLRRELVVWGDSVKLRYGSTPSDCPYLWHRMEMYTQQTVEIFHGIRLDNCHSTPIHVAEHMMRYARNIRPDLYVIAELFTSHEDIDNIFVNRLGLNSLIREGLSAWNAHEQGRLVYRYGGRPVGSFVQPNIQLLKPTIAHALFMDVTHDNDSVVNKRTVYDSLSLSAYIAMACCATGSNRGYDELVPHHISVVNETRPYTSWSSLETDNKPGMCTVHSGIVSAKLALNSLHQHMGQSGYEQVYVHDLSDEVVSITRHNPLSHHSYICVVRSAFSADLDPHPHCDKLSFEGKVKTVTMYGRVTQRGNTRQYARHSEYLNGLESYVGSVQTDVSISEVPGITCQQSSETKQSISFNYFPPGSVFIIEVLPNTGLVTAQQDLLSHISVIHEYIAGGAKLSDECERVHNVMSKLTLADINNIMYHCDAEERSITGYGCYSVANYGTFVYAGLQGILSPMARIRADNDLGHSICQNLREGDWLLDYMTNRMALYKSLAQFKEFIQELCECVKSLPRYLIPCYFDVLLVGISLLINHTVWNNMNRFVIDGSPLVKDLAASSLQFCGIVKSARLASLPQAVESDYKHRVTGEIGLVSVSAGLPHFSEGLMRIWGRDTFISLRGLLLVTGRFRDARAIILSFAGTLRHGLIPNLHGEGLHARYNCRDAVWWWLQAIQDYCELVDDGQEILKDEVLRIYPTDDCPAYSNGNVVQPLMEVMQEALQRHSEGINFRERNAGPGIDEHMADEGFNVQAAIDWNTGFVYGGNPMNCGTWMDKMGSSEKTGNKGKPATPRNGSAIELVALCASTVRWLAKAYKKGLYKYEGVAGKRSGWSHTQLITFDVWYELIKRNFEPYFWVDCTNSSMEHEVRPDLINKRNIYKDCMGSTPEWADYQLRPNYPVAMVIAPDLFTTENAAAALLMAEEHLLAPLGMRTLDKSDWSYNGDYINSNDSENYNIAKGFNYHNGPEWLWPLGYFLRAKLIVAKQLDKAKAGTLDMTIHWIENRLSSHHLAMLSNDWKSLPELTNTDGSVCSDSCPAQAWSVSCLLDTLYDISLLSSP